MNSTATVMEDNKEIADVVLKTNLVLIIVLPIVFIFLILYSIDFYRYHRRKSSSRGARHYRRIRVGAELVTNTGVNKKPALLKHQKRLSLQARRASIKQSKQKYFRTIEDGIKGTVSIIIPEANHDYADISHLHSAKTPEIPRDTGHVSLVHISRESGANGFDNHFEVGGFM